MAGHIDTYFDVLGGIGHAVRASDAQGAAMTVVDAVDWTIDTARAAHRAGGKLMFVGNGGSAAVASHMAIDYSKNGGLRALAFNDGAALTCLANDLGYENVFAEQIEWHGREGDLLIAISSSGNSENIVRAVETARAKRIAALTLSGFKPDNLLRSKGDVNLYVPNGLYGFVEIAHLALCHAILDIATGWRGRELAEPLHAHA